MEFMPRNTRAQSMDILSSQSNLAGYKAVLDAAAAYDRVFPMMMTAAGTVSAARVFVMGVGVAGLQAIATARRSEEHTSELQSLMRNSYAVFCLKKKRLQDNTVTYTTASSKHR